MQTVNTTSTKRDLYWDSAKAWLLYLVILGHFTKGQLEYSATLSGLTTFIYAFHMPVFIFISGLFSKKIVSPRFKEIGSLLAVYVIFQAIYAVYFQSLGKPASLNPFQPNDHLWYLFALFAWRTFIPYFRKIKAPVAIAILISIVSGFFELGPGLDKAFGYLPFFVLGYFHSFKKTKNPSFLSVAAAFIICFAGIICLVLGKYWLIPGGSIFHFFWKPYGAFGAYSMVMPVVRMGAIVSAVTLGYCFLNTVPESKFMAKLGMYSIYPYLLHNLFVEAFCQYVPYTRGLSELIFLALSFLILWLCALERVRSVFKFLVEPNMSWLKQAKLEQSST
ncbi:acyltransferase family protein [Sphaerothrix gracilis]|uniref:acyltransferase family protein n=1 Tax=Sphaerothrix gracilis TaxID=3151835 RepID=UPI0031FC9075